MLARTRDLAEKILAWYEAFEFHRVYQAVNEFAIVDLSSFYLDVLKDRMYTFAPSSQARRSAQTVLWQITEALVRLVAPILSFTADEIWEHLPAVEGREASVHLALFPKPEEIFSGNPAPVLEEWKQLLQIRGFVMQRLEEARQDKKIGKSTEAAVKSLAAGDVLNLLQRHAGGLREFLGVSDVVIGESSSDLRWEVPIGASFFLTMITSDDHSFAVYPASGHKCARCWNFMPEVANYGIWQNVCTRCHDALTEMGIAPPQAEAAQ